MSMFKVLRREYRVAFSKGGQSRRVRIAKWTVFLGIAAALYGSDFFWIWAGGLPVCGIVVHFFYRWQTHGWTRAWGGWTEVDFDDDTTRD